MSFRSKNILSISKAFRAFSRKLVYSDQLLYVSDAIWEIVYFTNNRLGENENRKVLEDFHNCGIYSEFFLTKMNFVYE